MVIRQALIPKFLAKDIENLRIAETDSPGEWSFLRNPHRLCLRKIMTTLILQMRIMLSGQTAAVDEELFSILKDLRKKISKLKDVPPFVIFQDPSLEDMAIQYPITSMSFQNISGVGAGKAQRYGKEFIEIIKKYVEEKEIIRPLDMVVKSVVNKSGIKVYIIQSIDMKRPFEDIAEAKGLEMNELISEVEAIVNSRN